MQDIDTELELVAQRWVALLQRFDRTCPGLELRLLRRVDRLLHREPGDWNRHCTQQPDSDSDYWLG